MENLNRKELLLSKDVLAKIILKTKLINFESVNKGSFQFRENIDGISYFINFKYDDSADLSFDLGCTIKDVLDADCFEIEEVRPGFNRKNKKVLVYWQYE